MSESEHQPQWELLPFNPEGFFQLETGYSRKDLKRSYNRLLRQFKPEKFPDEFQKLRAAFEELDQQLRYGTKRKSQPFDLASLEQYQWPIPEETTAPPERNRSEVKDDRAVPSETLKPVRKTPISERLQTESAESIYRELARLEDKSPYDYFSLALLSDVLPDRKPINFAKWLLAGMKAHPHDPAMYNLLMTYFRSEIPAGLAAKLVKLASKVIRGDRYFFLTERLWDGLIRSLSFPAFRRLLEDCESSLQDHEINNRITFYVHLLKIAIWKADLDWISDAFALLEENHQEIPYSMHYDIEVLYALKDYIEYRGEFLDGNPIRAMIDQAIQTFCTADEIEIDRYIIDCHLKLALNADELLAAFRSEAETSFEPVYSIWIFVGDEIADRIEIEPQSVNQDFDGDLVGSLLKSMERNRDRSLVGRIWNFSVIVYQLSRALVYLTIFGLFLWGWISLLGHLSDPPNKLSGEFVFPLGCLSIPFGVAINHWGTKRLWHYICHFMAEQCYHKIWRVQLLQFLRRTFVPFSDLNDYLNAAQSNDIFCSTWVVLHSRHDYGLAFFSSAQRFLV